jgi:uncharacterized NAD(P)/FAD-binding protein YdhS
MEIAILGGGPSGLLLYKKLMETGAPAVEVSIFERKQLLGAGMPYSRDGAGDEHITNVSGNEIPDLVTSVEDWIKTVDQDTLNRFRITPEQYNDFKVLPRLLFGRYLSDQFGLLLQQAKEKGMPTRVYYGTEVVDIEDMPEAGKVKVWTKERGEFAFDRVVICTGHDWPLRKEGVVPGYFDSPYPPRKLAFKTDHTVAVRGSSLTAIDALRTLARGNGHFTKDDTGKVCYTPGSENFRIIMHSRNGLLPAVRFHLEDSHLSKDSVLSDEEIACVRAENEGFLPLDHIYKRNFLEPIAEQRPEFYQLIRDLTIEDFFEKMMSLRENTPPFELLKAEYDEAERSIERKRSVYWKEMLAVLSFAMNYPAKYFSAEDMQRLQKTLMPLISVVIAFAPQQSVAEMLALHEAGILSMVSVGGDSEVEVHPDGGIVYHYDGQQHRFETFVDCIGQPHLSYNDLPYPSLIKKRTVTSAKLKFRDAENGKAALNSGDTKVDTDQYGDYYLCVPGVAINDHFQVIDIYGALNERIYMMAVPYIGGFNPDYSGLDFGEAASARIIGTLLANT